MINKEKVLIKDLLGLASVLDKQDIIDILLVWEGFKPAAMVDISYFPSKKYSGEQFYKSIEKLETVLTGLNLKYILRINKPKSKNEITEYSLIAKNKSVLTRLERANSEKDDYKRRIKTGRLMGYPESAVKAFAEGRSISLNKLPKNTVSKPEFKLLNFRLSREWRKEILYLQEKAEALQKILSKL